MLRPTLAFLAVLSLATAPLLAAQQGGRASGARGDRPHSTRPGGPIADPAPDNKPTAEAIAAAAAVAKGPLPGVSLDRVVAIINEGVVTESELRDEIAQVTRRAKEQNRKLPSDEEVRKQVLDYLIVQEVQLQRAERIGIKVTDEQLLTTIERLAKDNKLTLQQLPAVMAAQGIDYASYREDTRKKIVLQQLQQKEVRNKMNITPRELEQAVERLKKLPGQSDEYDVSDILLAKPTDVTQSQVRDLEKKAQEVYERAVKEDFAQTAAAYSNASTALEGGALGWRKGSNLPTDLAAIIVALKPGEVSKPIETPNGFHIVKLNGIRRAEGNPIQDQVHVRHILIRPNTLQDDATVSLKLSGIRQKILDGQDFTVFASSMSEDKASAVNGGEMDWRSPDEFVPEFSAAVAALKDGEISPPFQTEYGWHIVQLLGRRQFDVTEDSLRERAYQQLAESRLDADLEAWLRHLRDEAYIETDL